MKSLKEYFYEITGEQEADMRPKRIMAEQNNGNEAIWNSTNDRWSRKAKHQMREADKAILEADWEKGDIAIYEGQAVEVTIPNGPNHTIGIEINGKTKMVGSNSLSRLDEGVIGGLKPLDPINRIMQLAGISTPLIVGKETDQSTLSEDVVVESAAVTMFDSMFKQNLNGPFKNNPSAARVATIGQVMLGLDTQVKELAGSIDQSLIEKIEAMVALGASLVDTAKKMTKPDQAGE